MPSTAELREEIVLTAREMRRAGLVMATTGNVSARDRDAILITPASRPYEETAPGDVVAIDGSGAVLAGEHEPSSEWRLHRTVYERRPKASAIVHTHSPYATAWSFLGEELDTRTEELEIVVGGAVRTAPFAPTGTEEIGAGAADALAGRRAALLARHGVVGAGPTLRAALDACLVVEQQAHIAWLLRG